MIITHKTFLYWLIYAVCVVFVTVGLSAFGIPQMALAYDYSQLTLLLFLMYGLAEILAGIQVWAVSRRHKQVQESLRFVRSHGFSKMKRLSDGQVLLMSVNESTLSLPPSIFSEFLSDLDDKAGNSGVARDPKILLDSFGEKMFRKSGIGDFVASRIVWVGIFATIVGVILSFWPFINMGFDPEAMREALPEFFSGVAVAFIPTAVSFVFKIALDINTRIINGGVEETLEMATVIADAHIMPRLGRQ
jgi:hypothetical protein